MTNKASRKENRAQINLAMGLVGLIAICSLLAMKATDSVQDLTILPALAMVISLGIMFATRNSDEYTQGLWVAGANAAFILIVFWVIFLPFVEGFYDGVRGDEGGMDFPADLGGYVAICAFFLTFNIKRLTGAL